MKFSCCIELLFTEYPFVERIYHAKECGFDAIEFWNWTDKDCAKISRALEDTGMEVGIFQGNIHGRMVDAKDQQLYLQGVQESVKTAKQLGCKNLFLMSDIMREDRSVLEMDPPITDEEKLEQTKRVLTELKEVSDRENINFLIEPLNIKVDHPGYSLCHSKPAFDLIREIGHPGIRVLYDAYHMQIMEGNIIQTIRDHVQEIGYFHVADVPGRMEPGTGEMNFKNIIRALGEAGYDKIVGFEFSSSQKDSKKILQTVLDQIKRGDDI